MRPAAAGLGAAVLLFASSAMAEEAKKGMPQLDFHNPLTTAQVVWLAIIFLALYLLLSRWALPQVAEVLESRAKSIAADLDAARAAKQSADGAIAELTEATRTAQQGARAQIAAAVEEAKAAAATQSAALDTRLEKQLAAAEIQIAAARSAALGALREVATDATNVLVSRLTGAAADTASVDRAVGAALAARPSA